MTEDAEALLDELFALWRSQPSPVAPERPDSGTFYAPAVPAVVKTTPAAHLGTQLGERLVKEILNGVRAGRQGIFISEPERLRTAIFIRGYSLGDFARLAGIAPSTLSRALAGQPVAPQSWRALMFALDRT